MNFEEKTLDLSGLNKFTFQGRLRMRHIQDWANDYYAKGYRLALVRLDRDIYYELIADIKLNNHFIRAEDTDFKRVSLDFGYGDIEIRNDSDALQEKRRKTYEDEKFIDLMTGKRKKVR